MDLYAESGGLPIITIYGHVILGSTPPLGDIEVPIAIFGIPVALAAYEICCKEHWRGEI